MNTYIHILKDYFLVRLIYLYLNGASIVDLNHHSSFLDTIIEWPPKYISVNSIQRAVKHPVIQAYDNLNFNLIITSNHKRNTTILLDIP